MLSLVLLLAACAAVVYALRNHLTTYLHHLDTIIFPTAKRDLTQQTPSLRGTFWSLPPELRDEIFNLAYAPTTPSPSIKLIPITTWIEKERRRRDYAWDTRADKAPALPVCPLDFMLVSRQFYREATATWFRLRTVHMKYLAELDRIISRDLRRCVVAVEMEWDHYIYSNVNNFNEMKACCSLRKVRIAMKETFLDRFEKKISCIHSYTREEFATMDDAKALIRALRYKDGVVVELEACVSKRAACDQEASQWKINVAALEQYIREKLPKAKGSGSLRR